MAEQRSRWMRRRHLIPLALCLPFNGLTWGAPTDSNQQPDDEPLPQFKVSAALLQQAVGRRFPLHYLVRGFMNLDVQAPQMRLLPANNRLGAEMALEAAGPALQGSHQGTMDMEFALRYEASDLTVRAYHLRFKGLTMPSLPPDLVALLNTYGPALTERAMLEVVVHRLLPSDLALPNGLGMQPGSITVTGTGLVIGFVPKPLAQQ
jgi:hypothetical protein